jgi:hypothetical protein
MALSFCFLHHQTLSRAHHPSPLKQLGLPAFSGQQRDQLVAGPDFSRQDAEFVEVPITDDHLDRGQQGRAERKSIDPF